MLLNEFDDSPAIIEPTDKAVRGGGEVCETIILSFAGDMVEELAGLPQVHLGGYLQNLNGKQSWFIYQRSRQKVAVCLAPVGAPAIVGVLEELKAKGFRRFIIMGSCGILDKTITSQTIILPVSALRDEGTSYHYAPASEEIRYDEASLAIMEKVFDRHSISYIKTKTWTTDAFYRETPEKVKRRMSSGAAVVDMEAAAIMAWARFRQAEVCQFFYPADYVNRLDGAWEARRKSLPDWLPLFDLALAIAKEAENEAILEE
ncbi:nucleoside phosphorylase [Streptococcus pantholopis]|uniref:Uridine phosphorylase n=1 Tax=Streptococcus pantholopis TaxID=1811193 RepID=A0A172Q947_9STRE|nr:nucleoside phosphorylase [Streptococcus pantholopis]AND79947.1 phosphorylase [Streptococcus pantholopis]